MTSTDPVTILMFGDFYKLQRERGLPTTTELQLNSVGKRALEIAGELALPIDAIGCIYCNHRPAGLLKMIRPGDRVAFVPRSIPGPHNCLQGLPFLDSVAPYARVAHG